MPSRYRFFVPFSFEEFFPPRHLGVSAIANLEPCAGLAVDHVRREFVLGHDAFQIQFADALKQYFGLPKGRPQFRDLIFHRSSAFRLADL